MRSSLKRFREHVATTVIKTDPKEEKRSILCELETSSKRSEMGMDGKKSKMETNGKKRKHEASTTPSKQPRKQEPTDSPTHEESDNDSSSGFELYG